MVGGEGGRFISSSRRAWWRCSRSSSRCSRSSSRCLDSNSYWSSRACTTRSLSQSQKAVWTVLRIRDVYPGSWFLPIPDPGSRIWDPGSGIPDLGSRISDPGSRIPDPKTATKERGEKKIVVIPCLVATNFTKLNIVLCLSCWRKKMLANF